MPWFCRLLIFFFKISFFVVFSKKIFGNISRVSSSLYPDHAFRSDLGLNCLQRLSADDTSK